MPVYFRSSFFFVFFCLFSPTPNCFVQGFSASSRLLARLSFCTRLTIAMTEAHRAQHVIPSAVYSVEINTCHSCSGLVNLRLHFTPFPAYQRRPRPKEYRPMKKEREKKRSKLFRFSWPIDLFFSEHSNLSDFIYI